MAISTRMWIATRTFDTQYGTVEQGRVVADSDPLIAAAPDPSCWARIVMEGSPVEESPVVEATAVPGEKRPTSRRPARG